MTVPETSGERRFVRPADYYSSPTPTAVLPSWAAYGCGAASLLVLLIVFVGGAYLSRGGFVDFMDLAIGMSVAEMKGMYGSDVTAGQKDALAKEVETMRKNLTEEKINVASLQPFLDTLRRTTADSKVNAAEAKALHEAAKKVNASPQGKRR
jgi:hypothetical protein